MVPELRMTLEMGEPRTASAIRDRREAPTTSWVAFSPFAKAISALPMSSLTISW